MELWTGALSWWKCHYPIWRVLASSNGISSWTPLKPQHSNPNPNPLANQVWCSDFLTPSTPHHPSQTPSLPWISYATQKLMLDSCKMVEKQSEALHMFLWHFFPSLKQNFIAYRSSKVSSWPDCIFEIHQLWQSGFSKVYSNCCCSCPFKVEIIKIGQSSHKMYGNNMVNFPESTAILNACTKKVWKLIELTTYFYYFYNRKECCHLTYFILVTFLLFYIYISQYHQNDFYKFCLQLSHWVIADVASFEFGSSVIKDVRSLQKKAIIVWFSLFRIAIKLELRTGKIFDHK